MVNLGEFTRKLDPMPTCFLGPKNSLKNITLIFSMDFLSDKLTDLQKGGKFRGTCANLGIFMVHRLLFFLEHVVHVRIFQWCQTCQTCGMSPVRHQTSNLIR